MTDYRHAGMGWSNGPIAVGNGRILSLSSPDLLMLGSEHWHYDEAVRAGKRVLFRGMARQGFRPAELGWNVKQYVDEILRDAVQVTEPITDFVGWNEWNLRDERGDQRPDDGDLTTLYTLLGGFQFAVLTELRKRSITKHARLHFGAWAPKDETDYVEHWRAAAELADVVDVHAYGPGPGILAHADKYRALFPSTPIELTEWHSDFDGPDTDRDTLGMLANYAAEHQDFRAYYFLYRWFNPPAHQRDLADAIAVEGNPERYDLFRAPPFAVVPAPEPIPMPTTPDPWQFWAAEQIAAASQCPIDAVRENWPRLVAQLDLCGINDQLTQIAMIGTTAIESASSFRPVREAFYLGEPEPAETHRKTLAYYPFFGRGYIQLTHRSNYETYGQKVNELWQAGGAIDLVARPDDALDPDVSAACSALYFRDHGGDGVKLIPQAASRRDWLEVRRLVYGAPDPDGAARIRRIEQALGGGMTTTPPPPAPKVVFNPNEPPHPQENSYDCSQDSLEWAMWALGRKPDNGWMETTMIAERVMTPDLGLLDASGAGLAAFAQRQYGEFGFYANNEASVSWDDIVAEVNPQSPYPILMGGRSFGPGGHWVGVYGFDAATGGLKLANPADGYTGIKQRINKEQWEARGPWSMVRVLHPDLLAPAAPVVVPEPPVTAPPLPTPLTRAEIDAVIAMLQGWRDRIPA